jgi:hypothetical protein
VKGPALLLAAGLSLAASETPAQEIEPQDAIVVTAQRSGAPIWTIDTARGTILLVGEIVEVPKSTPWRPDRLEAATGRAQRVIPRNQGQGLTRRYPAAHLRRRKAHQVAKGHAGGGLSR